MKLAHLPQRCNDHLAQVHRPKVGRAHARHLAESQFGQAALIAGVR